MGYCHHYLHLLSVPVLAQEGYYPVLGDVVGRLHKVPSAQGVAVHGSSSSVDDVAVAAVVVESSTTDYYVVAAAEWGS